MIRLLPTELDGYTSGQDYSMELHAGLSWLAPHPTNDSNKVCSCKIFRRAQRKLGDRMRTKKHWKAKHHDPRHSPARSQDLGKFYYTQPTPEWRRHDILTLARGTASEMEPPKAQSYPGGRKKGSLPSVLLQITLRSRDPS